MSVDPFVAMVYIWVLSVDVELARKDTSCCHTDLLTLRFRPTSSQSNRPGDKNASSAEEEDQVNSLNELAVILAETQTIISKSVQTSRERQAVLSPTSQDPGRGVVGVLPKSETYESLLKDLQFGKKHSEKSLYYKLWHSQLMVRNHHIVKIF